MIEKMGGRKLVAFVLALIAIAGAMYLEADSVYPTTILGLASAYIGGNTFLGSTRAKYQEPPKAAS